MKLKLPGRDPHNPLVPKQKRHWAPRPSATYKFSPKQLAALRKHGIQRGQVLNPFGPLGADAHPPELKGYVPSCREDAMKRRRARLEAQKAIALEAHELQRKSRESADEMLDVLKAIARDDNAPDAARIAAVQAILDRGYGKASQTSITASVTNGKASEITSDELESRIAKTLERVEDLTRRAPKASESKKRSANLRKLN